MMKTFPILLTLSACLMLSACADEKVTPQKSPCVGIANSPCGPKRPVNGKLYNMSEATTRTRAAQG